jgi:hypothetical protein
MAMIVAELIRTLQDMDPEAEVRIAIQPSYPMTYAIGDVVEEEGVRGPGSGTVYLAEGGDGQYGSREIFS